MKQKSKLYEHQKEGVNKLYNNESFALLDEQGMGKSLQILVALQQLILNDKIDCGMLICRSRHAPVWIEEQIPDHINGMKVFSVVDMPKKEREQPWPNDCHLYVINYELLSRMFVAGRKKKNEKHIKNNYPEYQKIILDKYNNGISGPDAVNIINLLNNKRVAVFLDESHAIANPSSKITKTLMAMRDKFARRYIATGTMIAERPENAYSQIKFLDGGELLGSNYDRFLSKYTIRKKTRYGKMIVGYRNLNSLNETIKQISIRRTQEDSGLDMPKQVILPPDRLNPTTKQRELINDRKQKLIHCLKRMAKMSMSKAMKQDNFSSLFSDLQKAASMPELLDLDDKGAKWEHLKELFEMYPNKQMIIWTSNISVSNLLGSYIDREVGPCGIVNSKTTTPKTRTEITNKFKSKEFKYLVSTMATLKEAVSFNDVDYSVYFQLDFSLNNWQQSLMRTKRLGKVNTSFVYVPTVIGSLDEYVFNFLRHKEKAATAALTNKKVVDKKVMTTDKLLNYLRKN